MSKKIDIEYCGSWGFKSAAGRLKNILQQAFPDKKVDLIVAPSVTKRIDVKIS